MDIKTLEQALKLQNDLATRLTQSQLAQSTGKMPSIDALLKDKEKLLVRAQAEIDAAIKERDAVTIRWDERVAQRKASMATLQEEMSALKKQMNAHLKRKK
jgi:prophage DNA circulation protein